MDTYNIDVTGDDLFAKNSGIIVVYNNSKVYAYKFSSDIQKHIRDLFNKNQFGFTNKHILKPRIYCAVLTLILKYISAYNRTNKKDYILNMCNDFDGHGNDIIAILKENLIIEKIFLQLTSDNYLFVRHPKKSLIQVSAENVYRGIWDNITKIIINEKELFNLIAKPKSKKDKW